MTSGTGTIRLGLVGCGRLAEIGYLPALARTPGVELAGVADPEAGRRDTVARAGAPAAVVAGDLDELLAATTLDGVILATPAPAHVADAERAAGAGIPVLVEKPPAPDAVAAARLVELGPAVRVGFNRRYDPGARAVRAAIGTRRPVDLDLAIRYRRASWRPHTVRDDVLADLAPHLLDWSRWLTGGEVVEVATTELDADRVVLELALTAGRARLTAAADRVHGEHVVARDRAGPVLARHRIGGPVAAITGRFRRRGEPHPLVASLAAQLADFATVVRGGDPADLATAADGHAVMVAIDAARASADAGGRVRSLSDHREQPSC